MTPLRKDEISLLCEDEDDGRSQRLIEKVLKALGETVPFAPAVRPVGVRNKNDLPVRTKFARAEKLRVFGVRDRDFLLQAALDGAVTARRWLDAVRGTLEDLAFRVRRVRQESLVGRPTDRGSALAEVERVAELMRHDLAEQSEAARLAAHLDALDADMSTDGPLRHRVDGRELLYDLESALGLGKGFLLDKLTTQALRAPPSALVADVRAVLEAVPPAWQRVDA